MYWLTIILAYLMGSIPTAFIASNLLKGKDIRGLGDGNIGAANAFRQVGAKTGVIVGIIDAAKGAGVILIAQAIDLPQAVILTAGVAAVIGHNWSIFIGFRGGKGVSTTLGILLTLVTLPMLIVAVPAILILYLKKNVSLAIAFLLIPLSLVSWAFGVSGLLIGYTIGLSCLIGITEYVKKRRLVRAASLQ